MKRARLVAVWRGIVSLSPLFLALVPAPMHAAKPEAPVGAVGFGGQSYGASTPQGSPEPPDLFSQERTEAVERAEAGAPTARAAKPQAPAVAVGSQSCRISTPQGSAVVPYLSSFDGSQPQPRVVRAVLVFHGMGRDVEGYYRKAMAAADLAGASARDTVLIAPQFLDEGDVDAHQLAPGTLLWRRTDWESGAPAVAPISIDSFEVIDALLAGLADRALFPNLKTVVLAGHGGGGQLVQRYAVVGRSPAAISRAGIHLRFVVANPSSYLYFSEERPAPGGTPALARNTASCPHLNQWKYGTADPVPYVKLDADHTWPQLEADYAQRDVIYLLGTADTDPHARGLDVTCGAEA